LKEKFKAVADCVAKLNWLPPLLGRITIGAVFIESGWGKLHNLEKVTGFFTELGIPAANIQARVVATVEFTCGLAVLFGLFTRLTSVPLVGTMVVAIITAKRADITTPTDIFGFIEYLYIVILVWLALEGAGKISLDYLIWGRNEDHNPVNLTS